MHPILDTTPFEAAPQHFASSIIDEYDDEYLFSPFAGIGAFLTGRVDVVAVRATFRSAREPDATGTSVNGNQQLADLLDDTCLGRVA